MEDLFSSGTQYWCHTNGLQVDGQKVLHNFLSSIRCMYNPVVLVCIQQSLSSWTWSMLYSLLLMLVYAGGLGQIWQILVCQLLQIQQDYWSLELNSSWNTFTCTFLVLFSGNYFSIHIHSYLQNPLARKMLVWHWEKHSPYSKTPTASTSWLWFLHCRTFYQDLSKSVRGNSWQCHVRSYSFHLQLFI